MQTPLNYRILLHIQSNDSKKNMVPEKTQNSKTIYRYIASKTHIFTLKLFGIITIDNCNIVVHIYSLFGP